MTEGDLSENVEFTGRHKLILVVFLLAFVTQMIYASEIPREDLGLSIPTWWWWFPETTANFLFFGVLIGVIAGMKERVLVDTFIDGARDMLGVALIIALARGITVIMQNGHITDTVLHWAEERTSGLGGVAFILVMFLMYLALSFLIPSSSGLATVSMPIMAPLAQFAGISSPARRHRVPVGERSGEPGDPNVRGGHGRSRHCPRRLRHLVAVRLAPRPLARGALMLVLGTGAVIG